MFLFNYQRSVEKFGLSRLTHSQEIARSNRVAATLPIGKYKQKEVKIIKQISKQGIEKLIKDGVIINTNKGYVNPKNGEHIGTTKTVHKMYIEDYYANLVIK